MIDARASLWVHPNSRMICDYPVIVAFNKDSDLLQISFPFTLQNNGGADEVIRAVWGRLVPPRGQELQFESSRASITEKGTAMPIQFTVNKASSRDFYCALAADVDPKEIPRDKGVWTLRVELTGIEKPLSYSYHLFISAEAIDDLAKQGGSLKLISGIPEYTSN
jgi:hypothetical protein